MDGLDDAGGFIGAVVDKLVDDSKDGLGIVLLAREGEVLGRINQAAEPGLVMAVSVRASDEHEGQTSVT